jgi:hypothetical protein
MKKTDDSGFFCIFMLLYQFLNMKGSNFYLLRNSIFFCFFMEMYKFLTAKDF